MKGLNDMLAEAYASWLDSVSACCAPLASCLDDKPHHGAWASHSSAGQQVGAARKEEVLSQAGNEKRMEILYDQPELVSPPSAAPLRQNPVAAARERGTSGFGSLGSLRKGSFSVRRRFGSTASSRRPHISAPSNFRHLYSESFQYPMLQQPRQRPSSFRPLELSIYMSDNQLSPILPHFDYTHPDVSPPPPAHTADSRDDDSITLARTRSYSSMSFHIPRRQLPEESLSSTTAYDSPPKIPPRARARAYTSPSVEGIVERIASAMIERDRLQSEIESVVERESIYISSRPSTAYGAPDMEPMPSIPALPAAAPSFAERLSTERPHTAPPRQVVGIPHRERSFEETSALFTTPPRQITPASADDRHLERPLAPPLPLVLRPPLRKKKSFSRVSNWLFPGGTDAVHQRDISLDSVTNEPRPVTGRDGFYQCVAPPAEGRASPDTVSTLSSWETQEDERTVPTTWSPGSSPATKQDTPTSGMSRVGTFGYGRAQGLRPTSVGVAF